MQGKGSRQTMEGWSREERRRLELAIEESGPTNWPKIQQAVSSKSVQDCVLFYETMGPSAGDARHRLRKWQQSTSSPMAHQAEADDLVRRLSLAAARKSLASHARRSSIGGIATAANRRSSLFALPEARRLSVVAAGVGAAGVAGEQALAEEQEEDGAAAELSLKVLRRMLDFVPHATLLCVLAGVSREWLKMAVAAANAQAARAVARVAALPRGSRPAPASGLAVDWPRFSLAFAEGKFLADGAYKQVYKVRNSARARDEAVSVMDVLAIARSGDPATVSREVSVALVLSELVTGGVCPNFVETFQVFQARRGAPWGEAAAGEGFFQYIRMELCDLGNLEECVPGAGAWRLTDNPGRYMKTQPDGAVPLADVPGTVFQMVFALYAARASAQLRHYDVKCLNYFCASRARALQYHVPGLGLCRLPGGGVVVKLADYGTADTCAATLGRKVAAAHFTTLENTPVEFLLLPGAPQSFAADTFALGLCVLHVLTGGVPYEEILEQVRMPACLVAVVAKTWEEEAGFEALRLVLDDDEDDVLYHTLYRFLVLFGLPGAEDEEAGGGQWGPRASAVFTQIRQVLDPPGARAGARTGKAVQAARRTFQRDAQMYSLATGSHPLLARARARASELGAESLVRRLCNFDPSRRPTCEEVLRGEVLFRGLVVAAEGQAAGGQVTAEQAAEEDVFRVAEPEARDVWGGTLER